MWPFGGRTADFGQNGFSCFLLALCRVSTYSSKGISIELLTSSQITPERVHRGSEGALGEGPWLLSDLRLSSHIWRRDGKDRRRANALRKCETFDKVSKSNIASPNAILASSLTSSALKYPTGDVSDIGPRRRWRNFPTRGSFLTCMQGEGCSKASLKTVLNPGLENSEALIFDIYGEIVISEVSSAYSQSCFACLWEVTFQKCF